MFETKEILSRGGAGCGESRTPGAKRGKIWRLLQRITYRNPALMGSVRKEADIQTLINAIVGLKMEKARQAASLFSMALFYVTIFCAGRGQ